MMRQPVAGLVRLGFALLPFASPACSMGKLAAGYAGEMLVRNEHVYGRDDDPELVRAASPYGLKSLEMLLEDSPGNEALLLATARGFSQYAYAFVQQEADFAQDRDRTETAMLRSRAQRLYIRGRDFGLRGLAVHRHGFPTLLRENAQRALATVRRRDVPLLYWTAVAWAGAAFLAQGDSTLAAELDLAPAMMQRALALDEGFDHGSIHDFYIAWEGRRLAAGGTVERAREHFDRALVLARGLRCAPFLIYAETVSVPRQDRAEFQRLLMQALQVDPDRTGEVRLRNLIDQKRARWLLARADELFIDSITREAS